MVRYYKKNINTIIRQRWMIIVIMLIFGLVNVNAQSRCCYNVKSKLLSAPARYQLNVTASHVDSRKSNNLFVTAITFPAGYSVLGLPFSPFSKVDCSQTPGTGATQQFECESKDNPMFFVSFELSVQPTPPSNSTLTASAVFIFGDRCQNVAFCTDLADKKESESSDKISLGPLGTWPKYAIIIGGVILGLSLLFACYLVYRRNRPGDKYRDTSVTPSTGNYDEKRSVFAPNSLLRSENENDDSPPPIEPPKNTLIQFGSTAERSKSVRGDLSHQTSTKKKKDRKDKKDKKDKSDKKDKNHQEIVIHDHVKPDGEIDEELPMPVSTVVQIPDNVWEKPSSRRNHDHHASFPTNRIPDHQTFDPSKPIPNHGSESTSDHKTELHSSAKHSSSLHHTKSKSGRGGESRRDVKSSNSTSHRNSYPRDDLHRGPSARTRQTDRERDRGDPREEKRRLKESFSNTDPTKKNKGSPSDVPREEKRQRKESFSNIDSTKKNRGSPSDVHRSKTFSSSHQSNKDTGKNNRKSSRTELSHANLNKSKSLSRTRDLMSHADTESTTSSSDIPLGDRLPLAMLTNASRPATKLPSSGQSNSWKPVNNDDDDTTPLGRISSGDAGKTNSFGAASTSSHTRLLGADKLSSENSNQFLNYDIDNTFDSVLDQVLCSTDYQNSGIDKHPHEREKGGIASDEEVPIGQLRKNR